LQAVTHPVTYVYLSPSSDGDDSKLTVVIGVFVGVLVSDVTSCWVMLSSSVSDINTLLGCG
jgi:heme/copper-type cytochrome/quinol oxidase subunit 4